MKVRTLSTYLSYDNSVTDSPDKLARLHPGDWERVNDDCSVHPLSSRACERGTHGCTTKHGRPAVSVATSTKTVDRTVTDAARQLPLPGLLKETPPIAHEDSRPSDKKLPRRVSQHAATAGASRSRGAPV